MAVLVGLVAECGCVLQRGWLQLVVDPGGRLGRQFWRVSWRAGTRPRLVRWTMASYKEPARGSGSLRGVLPLAGHLSPYSLRLRSRRQRLTRGFLVVAKLSISFVSLSETMSSPASSHVLYVQQERRQGER